MLRAKLQADQLTALKSGNRDLLEVLRFVIARIKSREIDAKQELNDDEVLQIIKKYMRELDEAITSARQANRPDLIEKNEKEKLLIEPYVPAQLSDDELERAVDEVIATNKAAAEANPKALLGICVRELKSRADSSRIVALVNKKLAS